MKEEELFIKDEDGKFVPVSSNTRVEGENYSPPPLLEKNSCPEGKHYYVDCGLEDDPDRGAMRLIRCRDCWDAMEVDPKNTVSEGKIAWALKAT